MEVKIGSPNTNCATRHHSKSMPRNYACPVCGKRYAMEWARRNHEKHCAE